MTRYAMKSAVFGLMAAVLWLPAAGADDAAAPSAAPATRPAGRERPGPGVRPRDRDRSAPPAFIGPRVRGLRGDVPRDADSRRERLRALREEMPLSGPPRGGEPGMSLGPEQMDELMAFTQTHFPEIHGALLRARRENSARFRQMLRTMGPHLYEMLQMSREDPALAETVIDIQRTEVRLRMLRQRYRPGLTDAQRQRIRFELQRLLEQRFDLRMRRIELEIAGLRQRLDRQRQNKERIIEQELSQWFEPPSARPADGATAPDRPAASEHPVPPAAAEP